MIRFTVLTLTLGMLAAGCSTERSQNPSAAQHTYGTPVAATEAVPAPAVAAEERLYVDRGLTIDGRITAVAADGCELRLDTDEAAPLSVETPHTDAGNCVWQVPGNTDGFAVAAGTLRTVGDTLRLTANGVRVTPVRHSESDS